MTIKEKCFELFGTNELYTEAVKEIRKYAQIYVDEWYLAGGSNNGHAKDIKEALILMLKKMEEGDDFYQNSIDRRIEANVCIDQNNRRYVFGMRSHHAFPTVNLREAVKMGDNPYKHIIKDMLEA